MLSFLKTPGSRRALQAACAARRKSLSTTTARLRRPRRYQRQEFAVAPKPSDFGKLQEPYQLGGGGEDDDLDSYLAKTSLSPWVPLPDSAARKVLDLSHAGPDDHHVDLGSGDGRVCFHALQYGVASSAGVDIDEGIVQVALERMAKRHPQPSNLQFFVADLLDEENPVWEHVQKATIITMYFATEALELFRPLLERKLAGKTCKIVTCGYEMPGWQASVQEVVLGTQIHLYRWGEIPEDEEEDDDFNFAGPDILDEKPKEMLKNHIEGDKFNGANIIDKTGRYRIRGFNPDIFKKQDDDEDADWEIESSDSDDEEDSEEKREMDEKKE